MGIKMEKKELISNIKSGASEVDLEGVEFKSNWTQEHGKDISAIANSEHIAKGWLVIGVKNDGSLIDQSSQQLEKIEQKVSNHIQQYLEPSWIVKITSEKIEKSSLLFIEIQEAKNVVRWNGKAYKLIGTTSHEMRESEIMALSLRLPGDDFSKAKYHFGYTPKLVMDFAEEVSENSKHFKIDLTTSTEEILKELNIFGINTAGILFGDFRYRVAHFDDRDDILDQRTHKGLYRILSDEFLENIQSRARKRGTIVEGGSLAAKEEETYPKKALREVFANAIAHSLYQKDQGDIVIEVHPNRISVRNNCALKSEAFLKRWFSRENHSTNKHLMETLRLAHVTDQMGTGKKRVFNLMVQAGKMAPIAEFFKIEDYGRWSVTLCCEDSNKEMRDLSEYFKLNFSNKREWEMLLPLLVWKDRNTWSEIKTFLDDYHQGLALKVLENENSPLAKSGEDLVLRDWALKKLDQIKGGGISGGSERKNAPISVSRNVPRSVPRNVPINVPKEFSEKFRITERRAYNLLKILDSIEVGGFSRNSFAKAESASLKTVQRDINFLKDEGLICYEGATKAGKYKVTEKYKKLLQTLSKAKE